MPRPMAEILGFTENSPGLEKAPIAIRRTGTWGDISTQSVRRTTTMGEVLQHSERSKAQGCG